MYPDLDQGLEAYYQDELANNQDIGEFIPHARPVIVYSVDAKKGRCLYIKTELDLSGMTVASSTSSSSGTQTPSPMNNAPSCSAFLALQPIPTRSKSSLVNGWHHVG